MHLTPAQIQRLAEGELVPRDHDLLFEHLEHCEQCSDQLEQYALSDAILPARLREAFSVNDTVEQEHGCQRLLHWLDQGISASGAESESVNDLPMLGVYQLAAVIGRGGMGIVYRATHKWMRREVAVKLLRVDRGIAPAMIQQFSVEFEAVGKLDHPHIVRAFDAGCTAGQAFLVMELLDGIDLEQLRHLTGPIRVVDVAEIGWQAASALAYAHKHGLLHRDIKPSNLMLVKQDALDSIILKVLDLGLARLEHDVAGEVSDVGGLGTAYFAAPEQRTGANPIDHRADVYGLGATLMKLVSESSTDQKPASSLTSDADDVSASLRRLLTSMTAHDVAERPSDMEAVMKILEPLRVGSNLTALLTSVAHVGSPATWASSVVDLNAVASQTESDSRERGRSKKVIVTTVITLFVFIAVLATISIFRRSNQGESTFDSLPMATAIPVELDQPLEREIVAAVVALGGELDIAYDNNQHRVKQLSDLPQGAFSITWIMLAETQAGDRILEKISHLNTLVGITLSYAAVSDAGVARLGNIPTLESVFLYAVAVTDAGVEPLTRLPRLRELVLSDTHVTDVTLQRLAGNATLERLTLKGTDVTRRGLMQIGTISQLDRLDLRELPVDDKTLASLLSLKKLRSLRLTKTLTTEAGLVQLGQLPRLVTLEVSGDQISESAVDQLRTILPNCHILRDFD